MLTRMEQDTIKCELETGVVSRNNIHYLWTKDFPTTAPVKAY